MVVTNEESNERGVLFMALGRKTERDKQKGREEKTEKQKGRQRGSGSDEVKTGRTWFSYCSFLITGPKRGGSLVEENRSEKKC